MSDYSIVTSFNESIYNSEHQHVVESVKQKCPNVDFYVYNENSYLNESTCIDGAINLDLFQEIKNLKKILETSKFKDCHLIGKKDTKEYLNNPNKYLSNSDYWNRNSIYWFRKVCAIHDCAKKCNTPIMIWLDSDVLIKKEIDKYFLSFVKKYDICSLYRKNFTGWMYSDMGITIYNLNPATRFFLNEFYNFYKSGKVFDCYRWDDCYVFDLLTNKCRGWLKCCGLTKTFGCDFDIENYFLHDKGWRGG